jgi:hypothetical protein
VLVFPFYFLGFTPVVAVSPFTWIATGKNFYDQLDWYAKQGDKLLEWGRK